MEGYFGESSPRSTELPSHQPSVPGAPHFRLPTINQWDVRLSMQIGNGRESLWEDESEGESLMGGRHGIKILNGSGSLQRQRIPLPRKREEP